MEKNEELKKRILKGIEYFREVPPTKWNAAHTLHAKVLHRLVESYLNGEEVHITDLKEDKPNVVEQVKEVFGI